VLALVSLAEALKRTCSVTTAISWQQHNFMYI